MTSLPSDTLLQDVGVDGDLKRLGEDVSDDAAAGVVHRVTKFFAPCFEIFTIAHFYLEKWRSKGHGIQLCSSIIRWQISKSFNVIFDMFFALSRTVPDILTVQIMYS